MRPILTPCPAAPYSPALSDGRVTAAPVRKKGGEESPGSTGSGCRVTPGGGNPRESATEKIPPWHAMVRVKWCGKSAPPVWQQNGHGKPHPEQNQIGTWERLVRSDAILHHVRVGCLKRLVTAVLDE